MNETTEKCSQARYARTILKVSIFLVKSDTVQNKTCAWLDRSGNLVCTLNIYQFSALI